MSAHEINQADAAVTGVYPEVTSGRRICRTPDEAFMAGMADAANDPPLTPAQRDRIAALLGPSIREFIAAQAAERSDAA